MKCDTCLNSRVIISENGFHSVCCLSQKKEIDCIMKQKDYYIEKKMDGRSKTYPVNPLIEKYKPADCEPSYSCLYCSKCPYGEDFKVPKEDKKVYKKYQKEVKKWNRSTMYLELEF